jgi:hypothetical protein
MTSAKTPSAKKPSAKKPSAKKPAALKTVKTVASVDAFLASVPEPMRADAQTLARWLAEWTGQPATMWGSAIVGFGAVRYVYESGRSGDWMAIGFSPRAKNLSIYFLDGFESRGALLEKLGRHSTAKACLSVAKLSDIDATVLEAMVRASYAAVIARYPAIA